MSIIHAWTKYEPKDSDTIRRNDVAQRTWVSQRWIECPIRDEYLPRLWKEEGRQFAYIKDVFDFACKDRDLNDIVVYTNADIHVRADCCVQIGIALMSSDACYAYRRDFGRLSDPLQFDQYAKGHAYCGSDLAAFRVFWWMEHGHEMPDMILGLEAWDPCFRHLVDIRNGSIISNVIGHERHGSYWERKENRHRLKGQLLCRRLATTWLKRHGINPAVHGL